MASPEDARKGVFSFEHVFLAEASNKTRHPRASVHELQAILRPTDAANHQQDKNVSHWWEAQLLHYGLKPTKTKAVAKTRLLDALNSGTLAVPAEVSKIEGQMKKIWNKIEKDKRGGQGSTPTVGRAAKRKRNQADEAGKPEPTKKSKATTTKKQPAEAETQVKVTKSPKAVVTPKAKASTTSSTKDSSKSSITKSASKNTSAKPPEPGSNGVQDVSFKTTSHPRTKQTARCSGRGGAVLSSGRGTPSNNIPEATTNRPRLKQTARRSKPFLHPGRGGFVQTVNSRTPDSWDDEQTHTGEIDENSDVQCKHEDYTDDYSDVEMIDVGSPPRNFTSLGLINGTYEIDCPDLEEWSWTSDDFSLILCLDGDSVWGAYDFGMFSGIMYLRKRPYAASDEQLPIQWRGRENGEGQMSFGSGNNGWLRFHGGGRISGMINCYGNPIFRGVRISGAETRSERSSNSMRQEWNGYNQREYDRENRARWGGSGW